MDLFCTFLLLRYGNEVDDWGEVMGLKLRSEGQSLRSHTRSFLQRAPKDVDMIDGNTQHLSAEELEQQYAEFGAEMTSPRVRYAV